MSLVNTETGEITGTDLATVDKSNAASVIGYLSQARDWLATCVEITGPEEIAQAKAQIATAAEATKQLNLSKEIQLDAQEMVRRAEYALGKAIRKGQAEGTVARTGENPGPQSDYTRGDQIVRVSPVLHAEKKVYPGELLRGGQLMSDTYALSDGVEQKDFDAAVEDAKREGNLTRRNVIRKVSARKQAGHQTRDDRADLIKKLACEGYSSRQMPSRVGVSEETVRQIARDFGIEITADKAIGGTRRHNSHRIASETVAALEGLAMGVGLINYDEIDPREARQWADSLNDSFRVLNRFHKQIKETTHA
jgi:hypothetical protein